MMWSLLYLFCFALQHCHLLRFRPLPSQRREVHKCIISNNQFAPCFCARPMAQTLRDNRRAFYYHIVYSWYRNVLWCTVMWWSWCRHTVAWRSWLWRLDLLFLANKYVFSYTISQIVYVFNKNHTFQFRLKKTIVKIQLKRFERILGRVLVTFCKWFFYSSNYATRVRTRTRTRTRPSVCSLV